MASKSDALIKKLLVAIHANCPGVTVWKEQPIKNARIGDSDRRISSGIPGMSDIIGVISPRGRFLAVEAKADKDQMRPIQYAFKEMIERAGGVYLVARDVDTLIRDLKGAL